MDAKIRSMVNKVSSKRSTYPSSRVARGSGRHYFPAQALALELALLDAHRRFLVVRRMQFERGEKYSQPVFAQISPSLWGKGSSRHVARERRLFVAIWWTRPVMLSQRTAYFRDDGGVAESRAAAGVEVKGGGGEDGLKVLHLHPLSMISNGVHESVSLLKTAIGQEDDEDGQKTAVGLEKAISKAAAGDLHKGPIYFRSIYLELKSQRGARLGESYATTPHPTRCAWETAHRRRQSQRAQVYVWSSFDIPPGLPNFLPRENIALLYAGKRLLSVDTPTTLQAPDILELNTISPRFIPENTKPERTEPPENTRYWTWSAEAPTLGPRKQHPNAELGYGRGLPLHACASLWITSLYQS
ncbi:hypothetical protein B0H14DRAFT_2620942 [Mycena olivaceomarginata]|nr:hypothetical protein B0H14DRAFT_2620942 [Mycena olivaceomarginata]